MENFSTSRIKWTLLIIFALFSFNFISALPTPILQETSEYKVVSTTDSNEFTWFENSSNKNTYFCQLDKTATRINELPAHKNMYNPNTGEIIAVLNTQKLAKTVSGLSQDYYGYCRNLNFENILDYKVGDNSTYISWVNETEYQYKEDKLNLNPVAPIEVEILCNDVPLENITWVSNEPIEMGVKFNAEVSNFSCDGKLTFRQNVLTFPISNLNGFYKTENTDGYLNLDDFESSQLNNFTYYLDELGNSVINKTIEYNYPDGWDGWYSCVAKNPLNPASWYECMNTPLTVDRDFFGYFEDLDPSLTSTYTSSNPNLVFTNATSVTQSIGVSTNAPVLFMSFNKPNETTGAITSYVQDNSLYNNFGLLGNTTAGTQPTYSSTGGYDGSGAYQLDGTNDFINLNNVLSGISSKTTGTISLWVKPTNAIPTTSSMIFTVGDTDSNEYMTLNIQTTGKIRLLSFDNGSTDFNLQTNGAVLTNNTWSHLVAVQNGTYPVLYVDGVLVAQDMATASPDNTSWFNQLSGIDNVRLGSLSQFSQGEQFFFSGSIDQVQIFDRALSASEVLNLYNGTNNNSNYIGKYARDGDFKSLVFYNATTTYWNTTLSLADTYSSRTGVVTSQGINLSDANLVSYWTLDQTFKDATGRNNGTATGTNNATGLSSGAMRFDGTDDWVNISDSSSLNFAGTFSISTWVKPNSQAGQYIVAKYNTTNGYYMGITSVAPAGRAFFGTNNGTVNRRLTSTQLTIGNWYHVVGVWNGTTYNMYVNGILDNGVLDGVPVNAPSNTHNLNIGAHNQGSAGFNGSIDEVLIYNKSLSASEVQSLYKAGLSQKANTNVTLYSRTATAYNLTDTGLVSQWDFNGNNANDAMGRNNGTASGTVFNENNGTVGYGSFYDGVNDYISLGTGGELVNQFTVGGWIYFTNTSGAHSIIGRGGTNNIRDYLLLLRATGKIGIQRSNGTGGAGFPILDSATTFQTNQWYHVIATYNGTYGFMYVNGILENSSSLIGTVSVPSDATRPAYIGTNNGSTGLQNYFQGSIDEIRIYNRSLSASEVLDLYNLGTTYIAWNYAGAYNQSTTMQDGVPMGSVNQGNFFQFKPVFTTNNTDVSPFVLNHSVSEGSQYIPVGGSNCPNSMLGNGTTAYPCQITSVADLQAINSNLTAVYNLTTNLDASAFGNFVPLGTFASPFKGSFYGNNKTISNLNIITTMTYAGLFSATDLTGTIENFGLINLSLTTTGAGSYVGGIVGYNANAVSKSLSQVFVNGTINSSANYVGGLVGGQYGSSITNSYFNGDIISSHGAGYSGGIVGSTNGGTMTMTNVYSSGNVSGINVGHFVGRKVGGTINLINSTTNSTIYGADGSNVITCSGVYWLNTTGSTTLGECASGSTAKTSNSYFIGNVYPDNPPYDTWGFYGIWGEVLNDFPVFRWLNAVTLISPTWKDNQTNLTVSSSSLPVYFNITFNTANNSGGYYIFSWYNTTTWLNDSAVAWVNNTPVSVVKTIPAVVGDINWTWYFNDSIGLTNSTPIWNLTLEAIPILTPVYPTNTTYASLINVANVSILYTYTGNYTWYSLNDGITNSTPIEATNSGVYNFTSVPFVEGFNNITFYANNTGGTVGISSTIYFTINLAPRGQVGIYQSDLNWAWVNFTVDDLDSVTMKNLTITEVSTNILYESTVPSSANGTYKFNGLHNNTQYIINASWNDTFGNINWTTYTFTTQIAGGGGVTPPTCEGDNKLIYNASGYFCVSETDPLWTANYSAFLSLQANVTTLFNYINLLNSSINLTQFNLANNLTLIYANLTNLNLSVFNLEGNLTQLNTSLNLVNTSLFSLINSFNRTFHIMPLDEEFNIDENITIKAICTNANYANCGSSINCSITSYFPNQTLFFSQSAMNYSSSIYNFSFPKSNGNINLVGNYFTGIKCYNSSTSDFHAFTIKVNSTYINAPDTTNPVITIGSPTNSTQTTLLTNLSITINENVSICYFQINSNVSNYTMNVSTNKTYANYSTTLSEGFYNITTYCNDTSNNFGNKSVAFTITLPLDVIPSSNSNGGSPSLSRSDYNSSFICNQTELFLFEHRKASGGYTYSHDEVVNFTNYLNSKMRVPIAITATELFLTDFTKQCGYSIPTYVETKTPPSLFKIVGNSSVCDVDINKKVYVLWFSYDMDYYLRFITINLGSKECSTISKLRWFFKLNKVSENYYNIIGIKLYLIITLIIILIVYKIIKNKKNKKKKSTFESQKAHQDYNPRPHNEKY